MPIPSWVNIPDASLDPDEPITSEIGFAFRDNIKAAFGAQPGAPLLNRGAINIGGSGCDLNAVDATSLVGSGLYDFESINWTIAKTLPVMTILRVTGAVNISGVITPTQASPLDQANLRKFGAATTLYDSAGPSPWTESSIMTGFMGQQGPGVTPNNRFWEEFSRHPLIGSADYGGGTGASSIGGGGSIVVLADGPIVVTGTIDAHGGNNTNGGGGSGGSIILVSGTSISVAGANMNVAGGYATGLGYGSGTGGYIGLVAPTISGLGSLTTNLTGNFNMSSPSYLLGLLETVSTLTQTQLNALLLR